jgi:hypothetical protein
VPGRVRVSISTGLETIASTELTCPGRKLQEKLTEAKLQEMDRLAAVKRADRELKKKQKDYTKEAEHYDQTMAVAEYALRLPEP